MDHFIDRMGHRRHFIHKNIATSYKLQNKSVANCSISLALYSGKWLKMTIFVKAGKWEGVNFFRLILMT